MKAKKKLVSALAIVLMIACILLIAATLSANLLFSNSQATPKLFGHNYFLYTETQMEPIIEQNAAVRFDAAEQYLENDIVLYKANSGMLHISKIARLDTVPAQEGGALTLDVINSLGQSEALTIDAVQGRCVDRNLLLGKALLFMTSKLGIILLLVLPCVLLLIYVISRFIAAAQDDEDDEPLETPAGVKKMGSGNRPHSPLFTPDEASRKDKDFEEKKASLAEHFAQKSSDAAKPVKKKKKPQPAEEYDMADGRRALEEAAAARRKERAAQMKAVQHAREDDEEDLPPRADLDDRVAAIKQAMEQRAEERRMQEEEEARIIAASKARSARSASETAEEPELSAEKPSAAEDTHTRVMPAARATGTAAHTAAHTARPQAAAKPAADAEAAAPTPARRPATTAAQRRPAPRKPAAPRPSSPTSFEELMAKLDEEKKKLDGSR